MRSIAALRKLFTAPVSKATRSQTRFWLSLSLTLSAIYALIALQQAFRGEYVADSDARQHVYWMLRFLDPNLFPDDLITDYHQSVAPTGYTFLYKVAAAIGIHPLVFNKLLPGVLGLITTGYCFGFCLELLPVPLAGFLSTLLLNQALWMRYDLVSGTPRAFIYPLLLAFLYYLVRRSLWPCLGAIALQGLFYPQCVFISAGVLLLLPLRWQQGKLQRSTERLDYRFMVAGLGTTFLVMLPYALQSSEYGPVVTAAEARRLPEFQPDGRTPFFHNNPFAFWLYEQRSSLLHYPRLPLLIVTGLFLPWLLHQPSRFPLAQRVTGGVTLLAQVAIASLGMFGLAHLLLFRLHLPSRYTMHSLPVILAIAAGITLALGLDALLHWAKQPSGRRHHKQRLALGVVGAFAAVLFLYPSFVEEFPFHKYKQGKEPQLYEFLAQQPQDTRVASLLKEANNLPTFAHRSVLTSEMYAIPYHRGYYNPIRQRVNDLIRAQYSPDLSEAQKFLRAYGVDLWLVDKSAFNVEDIVENEWMMQFTEAPGAIASLQQGNTPAISQLVETCAVFESGQLVVLQADCLLNQQPE